MHNTDPTVSIVIVNWNSEKYLLTCLDALKNQTFKDFEIIIIDNGSKDGSLKTLGVNIDPSTKITFLEKNTGFAVANNIGAKIARGKWLILLNADAFPQTDWLKNLIQIAENHPDYSFFSSRQIQANDPNFLDGAGDDYHVSGMAWKRYLGYPVDQYGMTQEEIFSACGAAALYSRQAFLEVEGFDEDFFSYFEDVDLGFRLQLKGYRCLYVPDAVVYHIGSATFGERSDFAFYHSHRNLIWSFVKNMPLKLLWQYIPAHIVANLIYLIYYSLRGRGKVLWRAKFDAIKGLPKFIRKRRKIQQHIDVNLCELEKRMQHGWLQPYLLGHYLRRARANTSMSR